MVRCPECSCPTIDGRSRCLACGGATGLVAARVDGRHAPASHGVQVSLVEVALLVLLAALVVSLSLAVLA